MFFIASSDRWNDSLAFQWNYNFKKGGDIRAQAEGEGEVHLITGHRGPEEE
jgi:hypothetical protein